MITKTRVFSFITKSVLMVTTAGAIVLQFSNKTLSQQFNLYNPKEFITELHSLSNENLVQEYVYLAGKYREYENECRQEPTNIGVLINPKASCTFKKITINKLQITQVEFERRRLQIPRIR